MSISRGRKSRPLYGVEGWPRSRGFLCTILRAMQSGTKVSVRYRRSGRLSGVVIKRGSTVINIYPPELTLKKTTESNFRISYLDISISICNNKYVTEVYDKRENFNFNIVNYPYMCSNCHSSSGLVGYVIIM